MKHILTNQSVNIRRLFQRQDKTYCVQIENYNFETKQYNPVYEINFGMFSDALNCVNFR
jgi:hypothetical protein